MNRISLALLVALAAVLPAGSAAAGDFILLKKNDQFLVSRPDSGQLVPVLTDYETSKVTVVEENYDKVIYMLQIGPRSRPQKQEVPTSRVKKIYYKPAGSAFGRASSAMEKQELDDALSRFGSIAKSRNERQWIRMASYANMADIYEYRGQLAEMIEILEKLTKDLPRCRLAPEALVRIGLAHLNLNDVDKAKRAFGKLKGLRGLPESLKGMADYYTIFILQKQGEVSGDQAKVQEALSAYRKLLEEVEKDETQVDVVTHLQLGIGNCLLLLEKYGDAQAYFQQIADEGKDKAVLAGAFNGLGRCHIEKQEWEAAVLCFLRTWILYDVDALQTAQALYFSGHVFAKMAGAGIGKESAKRAKARFRECMRLFPGTSWAKQSEAELVHVR